MIVKRVVNDILKKTTENKHFCKNRLDVCRMDYIILNIHLF